MAPTPTGVGYPSPTGSPVFYAVPLLKRLLFLPVFFSAAGDNVIIPGIPLQTTRVHRLVLVNDTVNDTLLIFKDDQGNSFTGPMLINGGGGSYEFELSGEPWFETAAGGAFVINNSAGSSLGGMVEFVTS